MPYGFGKIDTKIPIIQVVSCIYKHSHTGRMGCLLLAKALSEAAQSNYFVGIIKLTVELLGYGIQRKILCWV